MRLCIGYLWIRSQSICDERKHRSEEQSTQTLPAPCSLFLFLFPVPCSLFLFPVPCSLLLVFRKHVHHVFAERKPAIVAGVEHVAAWEFVD